MSSIFHKLELESETEYLEYFLHNYCKQKIFTHDGILIRFRRSHFFHAFFETTVSHKDCFSIDRAQHMPEIRKILESPNSKCHCGWNPVKRKSDPYRRVSYISGPFVVIVLLKRNKEDTLTGEFITCYEANNRSFQKIKGHPIWNDSMI